MQEVHPHDETQRIAGVPKLHSRRLRISAGLLALAALAAFPLAWRTTRGNAFAPAFEPRRAPSWPARQGIRPQSGVVLRGPHGERTLAWVDLEGSVRGLSIAGSAFAPLLGVKGTSGALLAYDINSDETEDLVFATSDRQLLSFDGKRGVRLAQAEWFAEPFLGAPVLCTAADGTGRVAVHSSAGKIARYEAQTLRVVGQETYHRNGTRGPAAAYDVDGDGGQDLIMGDEAGNLIWLHTISGVLSIIELAKALQADPLSGGDTIPAIRSGVCGYDFTGDGRDEWVFRVQSGSVFMCDTQGRILATWQSPPIDSSTPVRAPSPVLVDLTDDGTPEIVVAHPAGSIYAFQAPRTVPGPLSLLWKASADDTIDDEVALADLTGDEVTDVVVVTRSGALAMLNGKDGRTLHSWPVGADGSPLIEDLNGDGLLELIAPAESTWAIVETGSRAYAGNTWPTWRGDAGRTGRRVREAGWPPGVWWGAAGVLLVAAALLWARS